MDLNYCDLIVIEALDADSGIAAEYDHISKIYGSFGVEWELVRQRVLTHSFGDEVEPREVDILTIKLPNGEIKDIIFDITAFYGR